MATKKTKEAEPKEAKAKAKKVTEPEPKEEVKEEPFDENAFWEELVPFKAIYDGDKYKDDIFVGVNGKSWLIKRGEEVMIPRKVLAVIEDAERQKAEAAKAQDAYFENMAARNKEM